MVLWYYKSPARQYGTEDRKSFSAFVSSDHQGCCSPEAHKHRLEYRSPCLKERTRGHCPYEIASDPNRQPYVPDMLIQSVPPVTAWDQRCSSRKTHSAGPSEPPPLPPGSWEIDGETIDASWKRRAGRRVSYEARNAPSFSSCIPAQGRKH